MYTRKDAIDFIGHYQSNTPSRQIVADAFLSRFSPEQMEKIKAMASNKGVYGAAKYYWENSPIRRDFAHLVGNILLNDNLPAGSELDILKAIAESLNPKKTKENRMRCPLCNRLLKGQGYKNTGFGEDCLRYLRPEDATSKEFSAMIAQSAENYLLISKHYNSGHYYRIQRQAAIQWRNSLDQEVLDRIEEILDGLKLKCTVKIYENDNSYLVESPFKLKDKQKFLADWRAIPGRKWDKVDELNVIPKTSKKELWLHLQKWFNGEMAFGPKGLFRIVKGENT